MNNFSTHKLRSIKQRFDEFNPKEVVRLYITTFDDETYEFLTDCSSVLNYTSDVPIRNFISQQGLNFQLVKEIRVENLDGVSIALGRRRKRQHFRRIPWGWDEEDGQDDDLALRPDPESL